MTKTPASGTILPVWCITVHKKQWEGLCVRTASFGRPEAAHWRTVPISELKYTTAQPGPHHLSTQVHRYLPGQCVDDMRLP